MPRRASLPPVLLALAFSSLALRPAVLSGAEATPSAPAGTPSGPAAAAAPEGGEVLISAGRVERREAERLVVGEGAVEIRHREMRLAADRVVYHEGTRDVIADGNVVFDSGADRLQGEHLELNLDTRVGFVEHGQGFVQSYYFTGERIEKRGPDRYFVRHGTFTTCEGVLPDWSFHASSASVTVDEYLQAWNPSLRVKRLPVFYIPYAVFPVKRDRSTGLLVPEIRYGDLDGLVVRNAFYWAPRDNFDVTLGLDYLQRTGWGGSGELRYLLGPKTHGELKASWLRNPDTDAESWSFASRHSHDLPLGVHGEAALQFQNDRSFIRTYGDTLEERSSERTSSSIYLNRRWDAYDFALSARQEVSLLTEQKTTLTRFPELSIDRTSTRLFGSGLFLKASASGVGLRRKDAEAELSTTRLHVAPELSWPLSIGAVARVIPAAGYTLTYYSEGLDGGEETRGVPLYRVGLEGPRAFRVFDVHGGGRIEKLKHVIEPRVGYVYTQGVNQENIPQFDAIDTIAAASRFEYSLTNTLYAKVRPARRAGEAQAGASGQRRSAEPPGTAAAGGEAGAAGDGKGAVDGGEAVAGALAATQELFWVKLTQSYVIPEEQRLDPDQPFSPVDWEARTRPVGGLEIWWKGNLGVYGEGVGYQNVSLSWKPGPAASLRGEWRTAKDSGQDFLDLGATVGLGKVDLEGRSRYNLEEDAFVENRVSLTYKSQCWDVTLGYVKWTDRYEYTLQISLKGIGTVVKI